MLGVAIAGGGLVVAEARAATPHAAVDPDQPVRGVAGDEVADAVAGVVAALQRQVPGAAGSHPVRVGVGVPGMVDRRHGILRFSPNLPGAAGTDMAGLLADRLPGAAVHLDNDANCAALAELRLGAAEGAADALVVTLGTGIGGGLVTAGRLRSGAYGYAGEIGHMVVDPAGPPCPCGRRGCWERYASGGGLGRLAREAAYAGSLHGAVALAGGDPELVRGEHVTRAALAGDPGALDVLDELGWWVALGLANLAAVLDPEVIVVGGGLAQVGDLLLAPARRAFAELVEGGGCRPAIDIVPATFGERAGAIGAALLARDGPDCPDGPDGSTSPRAPRAPSAPRAPRAP
ncbi:MAG: ROK family protein, partial [Acidimicrobiales bacterium]